MTIPIPRNDTVAIHEDWILIAVKTSEKLSTYSFILINPQDILWHIDEDQYQTCQDSINVAKKLVDLEEAKRFAKG